ncbi:MAG: ABC transporter permease [Thermoanaerobaculaceae bacterium]|nr:ABC transporter permease [Thermoanaerobaculaceae bacterium]MDI9622087.1 ABC transporter permease [Acidobacteriota bacterium]NLH11564.1 FtsX-like permease family protein [Holophagae bacterium]HPW54570.1 ABC transporter permease [Thermoanaerobaculaceae bacterium]
MRAVVLVKVALQSILKNTMRSLLTMLGIIIGVGAVIVMVAVGLGAQQRIQQQIENLGTNMIVLTAGATTQGGVSQGAQSFNRLTVANVDALRRESTLLTAISPVIVTGGHVQGGVGNWRTMVNGVAVDYATIRDWGTSSGSFFDATDVRVARKVVVIGATVAANLYPEQDPVGQEIQIRSVPFRIIGVLAAKGQTASGSDQDDVVLAPYTTVQTRLAGRQFIPQILASTASPSDIRGAMEEITSIMREQHRLAAWEDNDFTVRNQADLAEAAQSTTEVMTLLLAAIASISLLVGGIGIMNIMLVSVTERTREIGIRLAIGARGSDVMIQFLVESTVMSLVGGAIGTAAGFAGASVLGHFTGWNTAVSVPTVVLALAFSASVGIFFGFYPARRASTLDPIEALRYE